MNKLQTLAELLGSPENQAMFEMDNVEKYKGYDVYEKDNQTIATKIINGGIQVYNLQGVSEIHRMAMKTKIDEVTQA